MGLETDRARLIKVYEAGMKEYFKRSSSAASVLGVVFRGVMENPNIDWIDRNMFKVQHCGLKISERTYQRSVRELQAKNSSSTFLMNKVSSILQPTP
jgi:hypothetical protein